MKKILAVLTEEKRYAERLCDYCNRKKSLLLTAVPFDSAEACMEFGRKHSIELLLADSRLISRDSDTYGSGGHEGVRIADIRAARIIGLDEGISFERAFAEGAGAAPCLSVSKYQPAETLIREVMSGCEGRDIYYDSVSSARPVRVIGVYSPVSRCGKSSFAITLGRLKARKQKTLYISLEEFSCLGMISGEKYESTLSDAVYHMKQGTLTSQRLYSMIHNIGGLEYIPPMRCAEDSNAVSGEDYVKLINEIRRSSLYEVLVIDMDRYADEASEIMEVCDTVYMPVLHDAMNRMKAESFAAYLRSSDRSDMEEKLIRISTPTPDNTAQQGMAYLDNLMYGSMGDLVRELGEA